MKSGHFTAYWQICIKPISYPRFPLNYAVLGEYNFYKNNLRDKAEYSYFVL